MMSFELHRHDARRLSDLLAPQSVDLICTSPPYFALRSYRDGGEHYDGQLGSEATPGEFVDNLIACTRDWLTVMRPGGSIFVNLGDKFAGSGGHNNSNIAPRNLPGQGTKSANRAAYLPATRRDAPDRYNQSSDGVPAKSRMGLPWRYAIRCIDELGLHLRADIIWSKPNGLPESVQDRVRISHEYLFHFTLQPRYFAAIDEVREAHQDTHYPEGRQGRNGASPTPGSQSSTAGTNHRAFKVEEYSLNPLGKVPGSVWQIPSEPLTVPDHLGVDHFAAFPSELPRRCILGWSPSGWCVECGEARRPVVDKGGLTDEGRALAATRNPANPDTYEANGVWGAQTENYATMRRLSGPEIARLSEPRSIAGYVCACPTVDAPTRPAVVCDPFAGTGTTVAVAHHLGRHGIGTDLSSDYLRLAEWRCTGDRALRDKVLDRTGIPNPDPPAIDGQLDLFGGGL